MAAAAILGLLSQMLGKNAQQTPQKQNATTTVQPQTMEPLNVQMQQAQNSMDSGPMARMAQGNSMGYQSPYMPSMTGKDLTR